MNQTKTYINISIYRGEKGKKTAKYENIVVHESTVKETVSFVQNLIDQQCLSHFSKTYVTAIKVDKRVWGNRKRIGKAVYFSFRGLSPDQTKQLLLKHLRQ